MQAHDMLDAHSSHASLNDGNTFWEMRRQAISSLCERHTVYLHKPRQYSIAYYTPRLHGIAYCCYATNLYSMLLYWIL